MLKRVDERLKRVHVRRYFKRDPSGRSTSNAMPMSNAMPRATEVFELGKVGFDDTPHQPDARGEGEVAVFWLSPARRVSISPLDTLSRPGQVGRPLAAEKRHNYNKFQIR